MIKQDQRNVRIHNERSLDAIAQSLQDLGAGRSILIDNDNIAIAGNGVLESATKLNIPIRVIETDGTELVAIKRVDLSNDDDKRKALAIADNRLNDLSFFDDEALSELLKECDNLELATGFTAEETAELERLGGLLDDLVENNFIQSIKHSSDVFSVTFVFSKTQGEPVLQFIKQKGKAELVDNIINYCTKAVSNA